MALPTTHVTEASRRDPTLNYSSWLLTINTNKMGVTLRDEHALKEELRNAVRDLLSVSQPGVPLYATGGQAAMFRYVGPESANKYPHGIRRVTGEFGIEVGTKYNRVHAHVVITVRHTTLIHLDNAGIGDYIIGRLPGRFFGKERPHIDFKLIRGKERALQYIAKQVAEARSRFGPRAKNEDVVRRINIATHSRQ